jgi:[ribosomal protein S5]-alanine N-acetyltransferase
MLETERVLLNPVTYQDLPLYRLLLTSPATTRYLPGGKPFAEKEIEKWLFQAEDHWRKGFGTFVIVLKGQQQRKIGYAGVEHVSNTRWNDLRLALLPEYQGKGYAFEAAQAVIAFTFSRQVSNEIFGVAVRENTPSVRLLKKLGMRQRVGVRLYDSDDLTTMSLLQGDESAQAKEGATTPNDSKP